MGKFGNVIDKVLKFADKNSPAILTGITVAGVVATGIACYKAGPKIERIMETHRSDMKSLNEDYGNDEISEIQYKQEKREIYTGTIKRIAPIAAPIVIFGGLSITSAIFSNKISARRVAALSAAYEIASASLTDYKEKIEEIVPKKAEEIKEAVIKKRIQEEDVGVDESHIYSTGKGDILCKDTYTHVEFRASNEEIKRAILAISERVLADDWVSVADLYEEIGIKYIPPMTRDIGWSSSNLIEGCLPIMTTTCWDKTGTVPVIGLDYEVEPFWKEGGRFRY